MVRNAIAILWLGAVAACSGEPIRWDDSGTGAPPFGPASARVVTEVPSVQACGASIRSARMGKIMFAAWWDVRADSSARLMVSRSTNEGVSWETPVAADTTDRSSGGCGRDPPAIVADAASGYLHLAYFAEPAAGAGIFYAHSMDGGRTLHAPVPIVFGRNAGRVSIASTGARVAVAYEDPNSVQPTIGLALSKTMGHIFEERGRASPTNVRAMQPEISLAGDTITVWWSVYSANPTISVTRPGYRRGEWK